ncbi:MULTISPECIES: DUF2946 family protein [Achromobacter]|uniref:DUF2946 family protein n=1 Tax=Achromobacter TaxID=222 RepID=UPI001C448FBF|nr:MULTISPECIES: DUF2946 family protein [unclassified Achromobacter]MBV7501293.1 DUF2946 family protein [Achromobacter sp. ACM05]MCG7326140.1 DUF2946 family protein [Achromobacter sp. ACRQX]
MPTRSSCPSSRPVCAATLVRLLLLLLLVVRAFVPVGYMPDAQALKQGRLELGFCAAGGGVFPGMSGRADAHTAHTDSSHDHHEHHDSSQHVGAGQECPFGLSAHPALLVPPTVALVPALLGWWVQAPRLTDSPRPPMPAAGPPLGQRAPPRITG